MYSIELISIGIRYYHNQHRCLQCTIIQDALRNPHIKVDRFALAIIMSLSLNNVLAITMSLVTTMSLAITLSA